MLTLDSIRDSGVNTGLTQTGVWGCKLEYLLTLGSTRIPRLYYENGSTVKIDLHVCWSVLYLSMDNNHLRSGSASRLVIHSF